MLRHGDRCRLGYLVPLFVLLSCGVSGPGDSKKAADQRGAKGAGASTASSPSPSGVIWEGVSQGLRIRWTAEDVTAAKAGAGEGAIFSLAAEIRSSFDREVAERGADDTRTAAEARVRGEAAASPGPCTRESRVSVLSIVGSIISYRESFTTSCAREAHPSGETRLVSVDLAGLGAVGASSARARRVRLADYFPEEAILAALRKDPLVHLALQSSGDSPKTLAGLLDALSSSAPVMDEKRCYAFPDDLLSRFAFHHLEKGAVAMRLGLPGAGPCRENLTQIGVLLPVPKSLGPMLASAAEARDGFLMTDAERIARGRQMSVSFRSAR